MSWRVVYIEKSENLKLHLDSLIVERKGKERIQIPLADINSIIIEDNKCSISIPLINRVASDGIMVLTCDTKHIPSAIITPISANSRQYKRVIGQIQWSEDNKKKAWELIVKQKITNQIDVIRNNTDDYNSIKLLLNYLGEVEGLDMINREGTASRVFFKSLYGSNFRRSDSSVISAGQNYGYAVILAKVTRSIVSKGLLPYIGVKHRNEYNAYNFSCDIMEPFRVLIDDWVFNNLKQNEFLDRNNRIELVNMLNATIEYKNKRETISNVIDKYVNDIYDLLQTGNAESVGKMSLKKIEYNAI